MLNKWQQPHNVASSKDWSTGLWSCGDLLPCVSSSDWTVGKALWENVYLQKWVKGMGNPCEERKKHCGFAKTRAAWNGSRPINLGISLQPWGVCFHMRKFPGHRLFQTRLEFLVSFVATNPSIQVTITFAPQMCLLQSLLSSVHPQYHSRRESLKISSHHVASLLESFTIKVSHFPHLA